MEPLPPLKVWKADGTFVDLGPIFDLLSQRAIAAEQRIAQLEQLVLGLARKSADQRRRRRKSAAIVPLRPVG